MGLLGTQVISKPSTGQPTTQPGQLSLSSFWVIDKWVINWNRMCANVYGWRRLMKATEVTAGRVDGLKSPASWLSVHRDQLQAQRSVGLTSRPYMGKLYYRFMFLNSWGSYWDDVDVRFFVRGEFRMPEFHRGRRWSLVLSRRTSRSPRNKANVWPSHSHLSLPCTQHRPPLNDCMLPFTTIDINL